MASSNGTVVPVNPVDISGQWFDIEPEGLTSEHLKAKNWQTEKRNVDDATYQGNLHLGGQETLDFFRTVGEPSSDLSRSAAATIPLDEAIGVEDTALDHTETQPFAPLAVASDEAPAGTASSGAATTLSLTGQALGTQTALAPDLASELIDSTIINDTGEAQADDNTQQANPLPTTDEGLMDSREEAATTDTADEESVIPAPPAQSVQDSPFGSIEEVIPPTAAIIGSGGGQVIEDGAILASGRLSIQDANPGEAYFRAETVPGSLGSLTIDREGNWTYTLNNESQEVQALGESDLAEDILLVRSADGTAQQITITVSGTNDTARITGTATGSVTEESQLSTTGTLAVTDADTGEATFTAATHAGTYGSLSIDENGQWSYALNNEAANVQALGQGDSASETFTVTSADGTEQQITVNVSGTNDAARITGTATGGVTEESLLSTTGTLAVSDTDAGESSFTAATHAGTYGSLSIDETGQWSYALNNESANVQALGHGDSATDIISVASADGTQQQISVTVSGTNDGPRAIDDSIDTLVSHALSFDRSSQVDTTRIVESAEKGDQVSVSFDMQWDGTNSVMPVGFHYYDLWITENNFGFNTSSGDVFGVDTAKELANGWHTVTAVFTQGDVHANKLYIDGEARELRQLQSSPNNGRAVITGELNLSGWDASTGYRFSGSLDNVQLHDRALTADEVREIAAGGVVEDGLVARYDFEGGDPLSDKSGNGHDAEVSAGNPEVVDVVRGADEDSVLKIESENLLANDIDVDGDRLTLSGVSRDVVDADGTVMGSVALNDGDIVFQAGDGLDSLAAGEIKDVTFSYTVDDGHGGQDIAAASLRITGKDDASVLADDDVAVDAADGTSAAGNVLTNDVDVDAGSSFTVIGAGTSHALSFDRSSQVDTTRIVESAEKGDQVSVSFDMQWDGTNSVMPVGFHYYDLWITENNFGFNTSSGDVFGVDTAKELANGWHTVTAVFTQGDVHANKLYIDGEARELRQLQSSPNNGRAVITGELNLSGWDASTGYRFSGSLDNVQLHDRALTADEVREIAAGGVVEDGLVARYDFEGGDPLSDKSGNGHDAEVSAGNPEVMLLEGSVVVGETIIEGQYGALTLRPDGSYNYQLDTDSAKVLALGEGETATESFAVQVRENQSGTVDSESLDITITGTNDAARITGTATGSVTEESQLSTTGTLAVTDVDTGEATFTAGTQAGTYGSLAIDENGQWSYSLNNEADGVQALGQDDSASETFTVTSVDGTEQQITVNVSGTNDAARITGTTTGTVTEESLLSTTGTLAVTDVDTGEATFTAGTQAGTYGSLAIDENGQWSYSLNNEADGVQALGQGDSASETFTVTSADGTEQQITVNVSGTNDAPVVDATQAIELPGTEDQGIVIRPEDLLANASDVDGDNLAIANLRVVDGGDIPVTIKLSGDHYDPNNIQDQGAGSPKFQVLVNGSPVTVDGASTFTAEASRGSWENFSFDVPAGTEIDSVDVRFINDAYDSKDNDGDGKQYEDRNLIVDEINVGGHLADDGSFAGGVTVEAEKASYQRSSDTIAGQETMAWSGTLKFDLTGTDQADYSPIVHNADGTWTVHPGTNFNGELKLAYDVVDGQGGVTPATATIEVAAVQDEARIAGTSTGSVVEDDKTTTASGTLTITDADSGEAHFTAATHSGSHGNLSIGENGKWTYTLDDSNPDVQALGKGDTAVDTFTVTSADGSEQEVAIKITGTNDAARITGETEGKVAEDEVLETSGTLKIDDVDAGQSSFNEGKHEGDFGSLKIDTEGNWTYALDTKNEKVQALGEGDTAQDTITVTSVDGTEQQITVKVVGTNDAARITGETEGKVAEDDVLETSGTLKIDDVDAGQSSFNEGKHEGDFGTLKIDTEGNWTYALDAKNEKVQALGEGDTAQDTFTVTSVDGTTQQITVNVSGTNDAARITGETEGKVAEDTALETSGTLNIEDVDDGESSFREGFYEGDFGSLKIDQDGNWNYALDPKNEKLQSLGEGEKTEDIITVQSADGTKQDISITIHGTNDAVGPVADASATVNLVAENADAGTRVGITAQADDVDGDAVSYTLSDDAGGRFAIDAETGVVTVAKGAKLDYEQATSHSITVQATSSDGTNSSQDFTVALADLDEPASLALPSGGSIVSANATTTVVRGEIVAEGKLGSSVDHWTFYHDGGPLTIDTLAESGKSFTDLDGDMVKDHIDLMIRLYDNNGKEVAVNDDSNLGTADGSTNEAGMHIQDSYLSLNDLPAGVYKLAVGSWDVSAQEVLNDHNNNDDVGFNYDHSQDTGPYQITFSGGVSFTVPADTTAGTTGNDMLIGTRGDDVLSGLEGNDIFAATGGADVLDGGTGEDIAVFRGSSEEYSITHTKTSITVRDTVADRDGTVELRNIETLRFSDADVAGADIQESPLAANFRFSAVEGDITYNTGGEIEDQAQLLGDARIADGLLVLDGEGDSLRLQSSTDIDLDNVTQRTASFWFKTDQIQGTMVVYEEGGATSGMNITIEDGRLMAGAFKEGEKGGEDHWLTAVSDDGVAVNVADGQWHHVAVSLDGDSDGGTSLTGFLDGVTFGQTDGIALGAHPDGTAIGGIHGETLLRDGSVVDDGFFFRGEIDDVRLYSAALDETTIHKMYETPPDGVRADIAAGEDAAGGDGEEADMLDGIAVRMATLAALPDALETIHLTAADGSALLFTLPSETLEGSSELYSGSLATFSAGSAETVQQTPVEESGLVAQESAAGPMTIMTIGDEVFVLPGINSDMLPSSRFEKNDDATAGGDARLEDDDRTAGRDTEATGKSGGSNKAVNDPAGEAASAAPPDHGAVQSESLEPSPVEAADPSSAGQPAAASDAGEPAAATEEQPDALEDLVLESPSAALDETASGKEEENEDLSSFVVNGAGPASKEDEGNGLNQFVVSETDPATEDMPALDGLDVTPEDHPAQSPEEAGIGADDGAVPEEIQEPQVAQEEAVPA